MAVPLNNPVAVLQLGHLCFNFSAESYLRECCRPGSLRKQTLRQEMYWGVPLVVRLAGEGKKRDWVNYSVVTGRGLSRCLESSEAWMALQSCLELGQVAEPLYSHILPRGPGPGWVIYLW